MTCRIPRPLGDPPRRTQRRRLPRTRTASSWTSGAPIGNPTPSSDKAAHSPTPTPPPELSNSQILGKKSEAPELSNSLCAGNKGFPVVVWIHGGFFFGGSKSLYNLCQTGQFAVDNNLPMVYVAINYRCAAPPAPSFTLSMSIHPPGRPTQGSALTLTLTLPVALPKARPLGLPPHGWPFRKGPGQLRFP